jgi:hypothetical protein
MEPSMQRHKRPTPLRDSPFAFTRPARPRGWMDRMLGRPRADLADLALQHLLSQRDPAHISRSDISNLLIEYDVSGPDARNVLVQMWRRVLGAFLSDDKFSDREIAYLDALREAFALTDEEVRESERQVVHPRYSIALHDALADTRLSDDERAVLARLAQQLRLPDAVQQELYARSTRSVIEGLLGRSTADRRLSPDELEQLASVARHLGVTREFDGATEAMLDRYALFWRIENGDLPTVILDTTPLDGEETCHLAVPAERFEPRASHEGGESEGAGSVRIARGVYYRVGSASEERMNRASLDRADTGRFLVTSQRVLFEGAKETIAFRLRDISSYQVYADGIVLERRAGLGPCFLLEGDVELIAVILGAALAHG